MNLTQHLAQYHLDRTSTPPIGSASLLHTEHSLSGWALDLTSSGSIWNEFVEGMRGGLEFIEYLRVGYCDPVEELGELFVDGVR